MRGPLSIKSTPPWTTAGQPVCVFVVVALLLWFCCCGFVVVALLLWFCCCGFVVVALLLWLCCCVCFFLEVISSIYAPKPFFL